MATLSTTHEGAHRGEWPRLVRHFFEMVLAMIAGMAVLGAVVRLICGAAGYSEFFQHHPGLRASVMAVNMTIGMALWMRHRGHGWAPIGEMSAAMFVPLVALIGPFWAGALTGDALLGLMHVLMLPAMLIAVLHRRGEYAQDHHRHRTTRQAQSAT